MLSVYKYLYKLTTTFMFTDTHSTSRKMGNELELIALIRNCEFLYNKSLPDYKDSAKRTAAWEAIAAVMKATGICV